MAVTHWFIESINLRQAQEHMQCILWLPLQSYTCRCQCIQSR